MTLGECCLREISMSMSDTCMFGLFLDKITSCWRSEIICCVTSSHVRRELYTSHVEVKQFTADYWSYIKMLFSNVKCHKILTLYTLANVKNMSAVRNL